MTLALRVLLEGVGDSDGPVAEVLTMHCLNGCIARIETGIVDKGKALRVAGVWITHDLGGQQQRQPGVTQQPSTTTLVVLIAQ